MTTRALVLGSGGVTGVAWEAGVLCALQAQGMDPTAWDVVIGSSAGSFVGAWLLSGHIDELYRRQIRGDAALAERDIEAAVGTALFAALRIGRQPGLGWVPQTWTAAAGVSAVGRYAVVRGPACAGAVSASLWARRTRGAVTDQDVARIGDLLMTGAADDNPRWVEYLRRELGPVREWPDRLVVTALRVADGARTTFTASSAAPLVRAVAASSAVPLVIGPVSIDGERFYDGGSASPTNADLAAGFDQVVVVAPVDRGGVGAEVGVLRAQGADVRVIRPASAPAALGRRAATLDTYRRAASARAGMVDGSQVPAPISR